MSARTWAILILAEAVAGVFLWKVGPFLVMIGGDNWAP